MQKILFNGRYGLTQAVIEGRKTMTRRIEGGARFQEMADCAGEIFYNEDEGTLDMWYEGIKIFSHKTRYKVGEVVAVAQSYQVAGLDSAFIIERYMTDNGVLVDRKASCSEGWRNKMFVRPDLMPHRIRITATRCERLQEISDEDCIREGVRFIPEIDKFYFEDGRRDEGFYFDDPREAFALLIDKVSGRGTWERNPWVVVCEFELIK